MTSEQRRKIIEWLVRDDLGLTHSRIRVVTSSAMKSVGDKLVMVKVHVHNAVIREPEVLG